MMKKNIVHLGLIIFAFTLQIGFGIINSASANNLAITAATASTQSTTSKYGSYILVEPEGAWFALQLKLTIDGKGEIKGRTASAINWYQRDSSIEVEIVDPLLGAVDLW